jgi:uncharacterized protein (DUF736 family)
MKIAQNTSIRLGSVATTSGASDLGDMPENRVVERKAVIGGGWITTPAVAAHVRRKKADTDLDAPENRPPERKAVIGGGWITTPAVAAHVRRKVNDTSGRSL